MSEYFLVKYPNIYSSSELSSELLLSCHTINEYGLWMSLDTIAGYRSGGGRVRWAAERISGTGGGQVDDAA